MAAAGSEPQDEFALVSSLYGPGTVAGWYLTTLSVLASWTLHPRKRRSGSIDLDSIAMLTLPAIAAAHTVWQHHHRPSSDGRTQVGETFTLDESQFSRAYYASFAIVQTFAALSSVLLLVAIWTSSFRRAVVTASVGLLCFAVECHVPGSYNMARTRVPRPGAPDDFYDIYMLNMYGRLFRTDLLGLIRMILPALLMCVLISTAITTCIHFPLKRLLSRLWQRVGNVPSMARKSERSSGLQPPRASRTHRVDTTKGTTVEREECYSAILMNWATLFFTLVTLVWVLLPAFWRRAQSLYVMCASASSWRIVGYAIAFFVRECFPRTAFSIMDLDQAVAAAAGATTFGFGIYSIAKAYYRMWKAWRSRDQQTADIELSNWVRPAS